MTRISTIAREFADAFETRTRAPDAGGAEYIVLRDGAPDWMSDVCRAAHQGGEILPDDVRYKMIRDVADALAEVLEYDAGADLDDSAHGSIDALVPVYNTERSAWLASSLRRADYVDEAAEEGLTAADAGIFDRLAAGIYLELSEVWSSVCSSLREHADGLDEETE